MADQLRFRGGDEAASNNFTGAEREVTVDTTEPNLRVHDGKTPGGHKVLMASDCLVVDKDPCEVTVNGDLEVDGDTNLGDTIIDGNLVVNGNFLQSGATLAVKTDEVALTNPGAINTRSQKGVCNILPPSPPLKTQEDANQYLDACLTALETAVCGFDLTAIDEIQDIKDDIDQIVKDISALDLRVTDLESEMSSVMAQLKLIEEAIALMETEIEAIQNNVTENAKAIEALKVLVASLQHEIDNLPEPFSGDYNDLENKPEINDGTMILESESGNVYGSFSANEASTITISIPDPFSGDWADVNNKPTEFPPKDHAHTLKGLTDTNVPAPENGQQLVFRSGKWVAEDNAFADQAVHFKAFVNTEVVTAPNGAYVQSGDTYIQHQSDESAAIAGSSWTGIAGESVAEGQYIMYGADGNWHKGKSVENVDGIKQDLQSVLDEGSTWTSGTMRADGPSAGFMMSDSKILVRDTTTLTPESGDGHDLGSVRGIEFLIKDDDPQYNEDMNYRASVKILTNGNASFDGTVEATEFIGDGSKLTGISGGGGGGTQDLQSVLDEDGVFTDGQIHANGRDATFVMTDTSFTGIDTSTLSEDSGDGHSISNTRGFQLLKKEAGNFNQTVKLLTSGKGYFADSVEAKEFIGDGSKVTGIDFEAVLANGGGYANFSSGAIHAVGKGALYVGSDTQFMLRDTAELTPESGDGHDMNNVRGIQFLIKDYDPQYNPQSNYRQSVKILTNGKGYFADSVESGEFIGDGSKLTGVMPLDLRTLPTLY